MFLNQYKSWQKEHPEYFQPATTSEALAATPLRPKTTPLRKEIFGYMPYWMLAQFAIAHDEFVSLKIYDVLGKEVATLVDEQRSAGRYSVRWDASNFSSGVYFYRLRAGVYVETKKLVLTK
jgi:hypothetical protein